VHCCCCFPCVCSSCTGIQPRWQQTGCRNPEWSHFSNGRSIRGHNTDDWGSTRSWVHTPWRWQDHCKEVGQRKVCFSLLFVDSLPCLFSEIVSRIAPVTQTWFRFYEVYLHMKNEACSSLHSTYICNPKQRYTQTWLKVLIVINGFFCNLHILGELINCWCQRLPSHYVAIIVIEFKWHDIMLWYDIDVLNCVALGL